MVPRRCVALAAGVFAAAALLPAPAPATPVPEAPACPMFPVDSFWHADVSKLPVHASSSAYLASIGLTAGLKADFGSGLWDGGPIGIPYTTVPGSQPRVPVSFTYADESDPGPYPIPPDPPIEGGPNSDGDRHVLVVDRDNCSLYELYSAYKQSDGSWQAGSGAVFDMRSNRLRPAGWTSGDAAGLAILPGLVRYDEVAAGRIDHAIRITVPRSQNRYLWPARHQAGEANADLPPMGLWLRLKPGVDISRYAAPVQVILRALKTHGAIVADNGSPLFMSGVPDERWDNDVLRQLGGVKGSDFEAVDVSSLIADPNSGQVAGAARMGALTRFQRSTAFNVSWSGAGTGAAYDVRYRRAPLTGAFELPVRWRDATTATAATFTGAPGYVYRFSVRRAGTTAWSTEVETVVPADDRALEASGPWTDANGTGRFLDTWRQSGTGGTAAPVLRLTGVRARRLAVLVERGPGMGTVELWWNGTRVASASLARSTTVTRSWVAAPAFSTIVDGTVEVRVSGTGPVAVDALGASRG